ncbi:hypothetical protein D9M68_883820 [compost metagenome]
MFFVSVPVLSVAIVVRTPIVSIARIERTRAFFAAMRRIPSTSTTEIATGRLSGTALTDSARTKRRLSPSSMPPRMASANATMAMPPTIAMTWLISLSIFF